MGVEVEVVEGDPPTLTSACSPVWICRQVEGAQLVNPQKLILEGSCVVEVRGRTVWWVQMVKELYCNRFYMFLLRMINCSFNPQDGEEPVGEDGCGKVPLKYRWSVAGVGESQIQPLNVTGVAIGV